VALLYLVEIHQTAPPEMGGSPDKAAEYAAMLDDVSPYARATAHALLLSEDDDAVAYWEALLAEHPDDADFLEELGRAHLYRDNPEQGAELYRKAVSLDPDKKVLLLDLGRYYGLVGWGDESRREEVLPLAKAALEEYLEQDPIRPLKAFALGIESRVVSMMGDEAGAKELAEAAEAVDPFYSKATGTPDADMFVPPEEVPTTHRRLFRPF
jgi:tetratricopeptide (TPR) repeat protein